ncbi:MAG: hypothetical protein HZB16_13615 [Armatimonadetes bacterium]|nr:hypothetical protein [Armatimonadota bacterium]
MNAARSAAWLALLLATNASGAVLENRALRLEFDEARGSYRLLRLPDRAVALDGAAFEVAGLASTDAGRGTTATVGSDGTSRVLRVESRQAGQPTLLFEARLAGDEPYLTLRAGLRNDRSERRVLSYRPLAAAQFWPGAAKQRWQTLNAPSGANQSRVDTARLASSTNNLLATFIQDDQRRSLVLGGLRTDSYLKTAYLGPGGGQLGQRRAQLAAAVPGARLVAYLDCGGSAWSDGPKLGVEQGQSHTWPASEAPGVFASVAFHEQAVVLRATGLNPARRYAVGLSWWDWDANGRAQSVRLGERLVIDKRALPQSRGRGQAPQELALPVPADQITGSALTVRVSNEAQVPNAVVCEAWLYDLGDASLPADLVAGRPYVGAQPDTEPLAELEGSDPVGQRVKPNALFWPDDTYYVDALTSDPFEALERYGRVLRAATGANPTPYDFPTVCAWYAGVWKTPGAQNHPEKSTYAIATTAGLVDEAEQSKRRGWLNYSRVAGRLVPDNYTADNPQGWWDDAHWRSQGFYTKPYDTSALWGKAVQARGALAFTYFQSAGSFLSADFAKAHPELLIPGRKCLDLTLPATQAHLRRVYANLRGNVSGMMFDYCDEFWANDCSHGGWKDPNVTATAYYRRFLKAAKDGLGPGSWIHERAVQNPPADLALGLVDSQRTSWDTDKIDPAMIARSGLRWYKNRMVLAYDMDSKELTSAWKTPAWRGNDTDGRRMLLTMAYVAASRLLLANSLRDLAPETWHDLSRTFPYPTEARPSARPVDAFSQPGWPHVYDLEVSPDWHWLVLHNHDEPQAERTLTVPLCGARVDGALGLDPRRTWYAYDFWNACSLGKLPAGGTLSQTLRPGEARVIALHAVEANPQVLATDRHLSQGQWDLVGRPSWDAARATLRGASRVVGGEPYRVVLAGNGRTPVSATVGRLAARADGLWELVIERPENGVVPWAVGFGAAPPAAR